MIITHENVLDTNLIDQTIPTETSKLPDLDSRSLTELLMSQTPQPRRSGYGISLYLPATRDPIEIWNEPSVTLGRNDYRHEIYPTINLSNHYASQLGVSRLHAKISFMNGFFYVADLGSKNGTWVNGKRLKDGEFEPLTQRDTLRISHLIILVGACQYTPVTTLGA